MSLLNLILYKETIVHSSLNYFVYLLPLFKSSHLLIAYHVGRERKDKLKE